MIKKTINTFFISLVMISASLTYANEKNEIENFPMKFSQMSKIIGPKDSVEVFIPKDSYLMKILFTDEHIKNKEESLYKIDFGKIRRGTTSYADPELAKRITNKVKKDNGTLITINLKDIKLQTLRVIDDNAETMFFNEYLLGDRIVLKANLVFSQGTLGTDYESLNRQYQYLKERYNMFFNNKHYYGLFFDSGRIDYTNDVYANTIIDNEKNAPSSKITLTVMNMDTYENYEKIINKIADKGFDQNFIQLNDILK